MRQAGEGRHGRRLRGLIVVLWRAGVRIHEALAPTQTDLNERRGSLLIRHGKGDRRREVGMDQWGWSVLAGWTADRITLPPGPLFCVIDGRVLVGLLVAGCGSTSETSTTNATSSASTAASAPAPPPTTTVTPARTATTDQGSKATPKPHPRPAPSAAVTPSTTALTPNQILSQGENAVKAKEVSAPILKAAIRLGTAQAQQLGQPNSQYVATATFIGYLHQLQFTCSDSPDQLATVIINTGNVLYKQDQSATYGEVTRALYQFTVGKAKHACAPQLAAAAAATSGT